MRIYIDTDELRSLARGLRADAGALGDVNTELIRGWAHTPPPPVELLGVGARSSGVQAQVGVLGARLVVDATLLEVEAIARNAAEGGAAGIAGQVLGTGPWALVPGGASWVFLSSAIDGADTVLTGLTRALTQRIRPHVQGGSLVSEYYKYRQRFGHLGTSLGSAKHLNRVASVIGVAAVAFDVVQSGVDQHRADQGLELSDQQRANRIGAAIGLEAGGGLVGAAAGAALLAPVAPPLGSIAGAAIGGWVGKRAGRWWKEQAFASPRLKGLFSN
ncbi:MAG: hypothetical protein ACT452_16010 [Microthrixaceae bacterium]